MVDIIIEGNNQGKHIIEASCATPGFPRDQDAYRSKILGVIHVVKIVEILIAKFNITERSITLGCDGLDAILMALDQFSSFTFTSNHFDILTAIHKITKESNIIWRWRHVKGHQDDHMVPLYIWAYINVLCYTAEKNGGKTTKLSVTYNKKRF